MKQDLAVESYYDEQRKLLNIRKFRRKLTKSRWIRLWKFCCSRPHPKKGSVTGFIGIDTISSFLVV
jgi:hypothetical protein